MGLMPGPGEKVVGRVGAIGLALTVWDVWRRLPPWQRRWMAAQARRHGPRVARAVWSAQRNRPG